MLNQSKWNGPIIENHIAFKLMAHKRHRQVSRPTTTKKQNQLNSSIFFFIVVEDFHREKLRSLHWSNSSNYFTLNYFVLEVRLWWMLCQKGGKKYGRAEQLSFIVQKYPIIGLPFFFSLSINSIRQLCQLFRSFFFRLFCL